MQTAAFKQTRAPNRPLTPDEIKLCQEQRSAEWGAMSADQRLQYDNLHRAAVLDRSVAQGQVVQQQQQQQQQQPREQEE